MKLIKKEERKGKWKSSITKKKKNSMKNLIYAKLNSNLEVCSKFTSRRKRNDNFHQFSKILKM